MYGKLHILIVLGCMLWAIPCHGSGFTVVIDPGHGGKDMGACGNATCEKDINLDVALRLGHILDADNDIRVVYTRTTDVAVDLHQRVTTANDNKADLFISIHCNSMGRNWEGRQRVKGAVTYVMGVDAIGQNLEVAHRENAATSMEENFTNSYQPYDPSSDESQVIFELSQRQNIHNSLTLAQEIQKSLVTNAARTDAGVHQAGFVVLAHTTMPSVLVELDFISNPECEQYMSSTQGADELARAIATAFYNYRKIIH